MRMNKRRCRWRFRRGDFPIAFLVDAGAEIPLLRALLDYKGRAALRARLGDGLVRRREIAVRIPAATVEDAPCPASLRCAAPDKFALVAFRAFDPQRDRARVLALRIILAAHEISEAARATQQNAFVQRAFFVEHHVRLQRFSSAAGKAPRCFAIRVARAREERAKAPALDRHFLAAVVAINYAALAFAV